MQGLRPWNAETLGRFLPHIDEISTNQSFIVGDEFTVAETILTCVLRELRKNEVLKPYPGIEKYRKRCKERPAFVKVLNAYEDRLGIERGSAG